MSDTERELLDAVLENPDDDLPRLVYADYLDEHGDPTRAEFIRAQIALCTEVDHKRYDTDEYASATKQIMKFGSRDLRNILAIETSSEQNEEYKIDVIEDVIRFRNVITNVHYHLDRGFPFCITASFNHLRASYADFLHFPIRRFRSTSGVRSGSFTILDLQICKKECTWVSSIIHSGKSIAEKSWLSRSHCFVAIWKWCDQIVGPSNTQTRVINHATESVPDYGP